MTLQLADELFSRYLDLGPLGGRRRSLVRCVFHQDRTASLSVDLDRGLFHCFGCGAQGDTKRFAELVGEVSPPRGPRSASTSPLAAARAEVLRVALRQPWNREGVRLLYQASDFVRRERRGASELRRLARGHAEHPDVWEILARAAGLDTAATVVEAELDAILAEGPLP